MSAGGCVVIETVPVLIGQSSSSVEVAVPLGTFYPLIKEARDSSGIIL